jgi:hypothetical protein
MRKISKKEIKEKLKKDAKEYTLTIKEEISTAILAAFAFLIALVWRDAISDIIDTLKISQYIQSSLINAIFVTIISVIGIIIIKKYLSVKNENKENK